MPRRPYIRLQTLILTATIALIAICLPDRAQAHTVNICWKYEQDKTTFYVGTYHPGTSSPGGIIIDGVRHDFIGYVAVLPNEITGCQPNPCARGPRDTRWLVTRIWHMQPGSYSLSTTCTSGIECPVRGCYEQQVTVEPCQDNDDDHVCNQFDNCPEDFNPPQSDRDGDGLGNECDPCPDRPGTTECNNAIAGGNVTAQAETPGAEDDSTLIRDLAPWSPLLLIPPLLLARRRWASRKATRTT